MRAPEHCRAALLGALLSVMLVMVAGQAWPATRSPPPPGCGKLGAACCCAGAGTAALTATAHAWLVCLRCPQPIGGGNITIITQNFVGHLSQH